jgi:hypothetical protein
LPRGDVEPALLRALEQGVIVVAFVPDLPGHAVEALSGAFRAGESHVGDRARDATVAVVERMDRHDPQVRQTRDAQRIGVAGFGEPREELPHLFWDARRWGRLIVHSLFAERT